MRKTYKCALHFFSVQVMSRFCHFNIFDSLNKTTSKTVEATKFLYFLEKLCQKDLQILLRTKYVLLPFIDCFKFFSSPRCY